MTGETPSQRELTAYHEAGHAVAAVMRGGRVISISIEPVPGCHDGETWTTQQQWDNSFVYFAGPWAEARRLWPAGTLNNLDEDGLTFNTYILGRFLRNPDDTQNYAHWCELDRLMLPVQARDYYNVSSRENTYGIELEEEWPAISEVARLRLAGVEVTTEMIQELLDQNAAGEIVLAP